MAYKSKWIAVQDALEHVASEVGGAEAWPQFRAAWREGKVSTQATCDGCPETGFHPEWLSIAMWPEPDQGILWFDGDKRGEKKWRDLETPAVAENIEVDKEGLFELWPEAIAAKSEPNEKNRRGRTASKINEAKLANLYKSIFRAARRKWPDPAKRPYASVMADYILDAQKSGHLKKEALKKLLDGKYTPAVRRGITFDKTD